MSAFDDFWDPDADGGSVAGNDGRATNAESYHDEEARSRLAFYAEAASKQQLSAHSPDDALSQPLSQASALSAAELSAAEEALFSQSSHRDRAEESERQRRKLERRARRERGIKAKRKPRTEAQDKREREYRRMRRKGTDYDGEADVGGAVERLVRRRLGEESQRGRLKAEAKERERKRRREEEAEAEAYLDGDDEATTEAVEAKAGDGRGINWNYADEGYATMPHADAEKLPYYVYGNTGQTSDASHRKKKRRRRDAGAPRVRNVSHFANAVDEADRSPRAFPLRFHQLKPRMDLRSMLDLQSGGSERMLVAHGRNARRLWARMVAGGARIAEGEAPSQHDETNGAEGSKKTAFRTDDGSLSNVSSSDSSASSERSYQPTAVHSQMTYGTTSLVDVAKVEEGKNVEDKPKQHGPLLRLMAAVHGLPKTTHRHQVLHNVARELGAGRRAWEAELRELVEGAGEDGRDKKKNGAKLTPTEVWALKSFLGVEGRMSMPPSWTYDPSLPTLLKRQLDKVRGPLLRRLRRRMKAGEGGSMPGEAAGNETEAGESLGAELDATGTNSELDEGAERATDEAADNIKTEETKSDVEVAENEPADDREEGFQGLKEEEGEGNLDGTELGADGVSASTKLLSSLIDELPTDNDPSGVDKYAKIIHESNIDTSNIDVALASFLNELTAALARLRQSQEGDASHFQYQHALEVAQEEVRHWHESVLSYLALAESLARPREANFYKQSGGGRAANYPENAPLATAVMATQAYLANGGGVGRGPRKRGLPSSQWEVKDEVPSSDESEAGDQSALDSKALDSHPREDDSEKMDLRGIQLAAKDIARRGEDCLTNAHLTSFTPISLTVGVAVIAKHLTPAAAELVSRQCAPDASDDRTPFDLMRNTIALIEEDGSLVSPSHASSSSKGYIRDEILVQSMQAAAMLFRVCIEKDPESVDHWAWYVATFLGMLCVSCGTRETGETEVETEYKRPTRQRLDCFHEVRNNASTAVADFVKFAQRRGCPAFHFAVSSMLEWTNAIRLLLRPRSNPSLDYEYCLQVRRLHAYHIYRWARADCSSTAIGRVHQLWSAKLLPRDALLDALAGAVERNPSERRNWVRLVEALGKVTSNANDGNECLRKKNDEGTWWGQRRAEEWADEFFHAPKSTTLAVKPEFVRMVSAAVKSALSDAPTSQRKPPAHTAPGDDDVSSLPNPDVCLGWLWNPADEDADADGDVDSFTTGTLPTKQDADEPMSGWGAGELDPQCEATCMKVIVACHLLGVWYPFVCNSVWGLAVKLWQSTQNKSEDGSNKGLLWLSQYGLDVAAYLKRRPKRSESPGGP